MKDPTLREGDIVVFPEGARVYRGASAPPHRVADFEDLRKSRAISAAVRTRILAMTGGARSRSSAELALAAPDDASKGTSRQEERTPVRVIYPHFR
jgi:hypothetical protein